MAVGTTAEASTTAEDMGPSNMTAMVGSRAATAATRCMTAGALPLQPPQRSAGLQAVPDSQRSVSTLLSKLRDTTIEWLHRLRLVAECRSKILQSVWPSGALTIGRQEGQRDHNPAQGEIRGFKS